MNISYNWLKNYLAVDMPADQLSAILTDIGLEVEGLEKVEGIKGGLEGVVVGHVLTCIDHPDSDHLHITSVDVGREAPLPIVCGAPNVAAGQKVLVATVGATLYPIDSDECFKIKRSKIRGVESLGMICAEDELGIGQDHAGIMVLPDEAVAGTPARDYLKMNPDDYLIGIGLTPNRIDAASHYGVARDLAAYLTTHGQYTKPLLPSVDAFEVDNRSREIGVEVLDTQGTMRYSGLTVSGVEIGPSPEWMQTALRAIGINPKNNVVDITNFVLYEIGQPLHAFDADKIKGDRIVVRTCPSGEKFVTLDGVERSLSDDDLMICNAVEPMCVAGVFGGLDSGVSDTTRNVFIESACFNPVRVRKTAKRMGLNTDSSFRFERGVDPNMTLWALKRAALLMKEYAGGTITSNIVDIYPKPVENFRVEVAYSRIDSLIGKHIPAEKVKEILAALEIAVLNEEGDSLTVSVPPYRVDVQREADVIEDILRIYGYNNVEVPERIYAAVAPEKKPNREKITNMVADYLTSRGLTEIMSNSLTKAAYYQDLTSYPADRCVRIINPLSNDLNVMRQTLLFDSLEAAALNINHKNADLKLYENGNCYFFDPQRKAEGGLAPYSESNRLAITLTGNFTSASWNGAARECTFFDLKALLENILHRFGLDLYGQSFAMTPSQSDLFDSGLRIMFKNKEFVQMGEVSARIKAMFDIKAPIFFLEMDFDALLKAAYKNRVAATELSRFPEVKRDLALLVDSDVTFARLREVAFACEKQLLKSVSLFDVYQGDKLPAGKKSYALNFVLEDRNKTLTDTVIESVMSKLIGAFERQTGATIRQ